MSAINIQSSRDGKRRRNRAHPVTAADLLGGAMACFCETASEPGSGGEVLVLRVTGEIDMLTLPVVRDALSAAVARRPTELVVDLAGVDFCCVHGFALLAAAARTAQTRGTGYALSGLSPHLDRVATLLHPEEGCVHYRSVAAAVTAIRVRHTHRSQPTTPGEANDIGSAAPRSGHRVRQVLHGHGHFAEGAAEQFLQPACVDDFGSGGLGPRTADPCT